MADWKQITARIRRARTSKDPVAQLSNLYEKTQDAMVVLNWRAILKLPVLLPTPENGTPPAAARFRRSDWKTKAMESAARLGFEVPVGPNEIPNADRPSVFHCRSDRSRAGRQCVCARSLTVPEPGIPFMQNAEMFESMVAMSSEVQSATASPLRLPMRNAAGAVAAADETVASPRLLHRGPPPPCCRR